MKNNLFLPILFLFILNGCNLHDADNKTEDNLEHNKSVFELSRECGKDADDFFKYYERDFDKSVVVDTYISHYNLKLNKCFILVTGNTVRRNNTLEEHANLYDANEKKEYASYTGDESSGQSYSCNLAPKSCTHYYEFSDAMKQYMEE